MNGRKADAAVLDAPYNVGSKLIGGRGKFRHGDFAMASGEMTSNEYTEFLNTTLGVAASMSRDGAVHFVFSDWRHCVEMITAGRDVYGAFLNLPIWVKSNAGQGSFYRSQHELVGVFRVGKLQHQNNVQLGRFGRNRSNVWHYAGANTFRKGRMDDLRAHPTVKPLAMICDAIRDCTNRGDLILDTFAGAGTTLLAAEKIGRVCVAVEIEPRFVDITVKRWQKYTGKDAVNARTGKTFYETSLQQTETD